MSSDEFYRKLAEGLIGNNLDEMRTRDRQTYNDVQENERFSGIEFHLVTTKKYPE